MHTDEADDCDEHDQDDVLDERSSGGIGGEAATATPEGRSGCGGRCPSTVAR